MPSTFETLKRERLFRHPPRNGASVPVLNEFVTPHLESFNALFDDSGLPLGDGDGKGLLSLALKDIGERVVFSETGVSGGDGGEKAWGTRMRSEFIAYIQLSGTLSGLVPVWIEQVTIARPLVSDKDKTAKERRVFPSQVRHTYRLRDASKPNQHRCRHGNG
jgi:DNA-directed RNA polymerase I subunit RPA2